MHEALKLARTGLGNVWPNPTVGCLVVRDGEVIGRGRTAAGGRPHAELLALQEAGEGAKGATVYVTLEPCNHWGHTPPCTDALLTAGLARVVVSLVDPDPRTNGNGIECLREAGIRVDVGLCQSQARDVNAGFFQRILTGRPLVGVATDRGEDLGVLARSWDAVGVHHAFSGILSPEQSTVSVFGESPLGSGVAVDLWVGAAGVWSHCPEGAESIVVPEDAVGPARLAATLAALGERGLTRLLIHMDDPLAVSLEAAGLVDQRVCRDTLAA